MAEPIGRVGVLKEYFGKPEDNCPLTVAEMKALSSDERAELADLAAKELGLIKPPNGKYSQPE